MDETRKALSRYRLDKAKQCLESAKMLNEAGDFCGAANRAYYAVFHSIRSILALEGVDFAKHSGVMSHFQQRYIKTGLFDKEYSKILTESFSIRSDADYDDYFEISKEEVSAQIENASFFISGVSKYVNEQLCH